MFGDDGSVYNWNWMRNWDWMSDWDSNRPVYSNWVWGWYWNS